MRKAAAALVMVALALLVPSWGAGRPSGTSGLGPPRQEQSGLAASTYDPQKTYPVETLKEDLKVLWDALEEGHAGFDRYTPAAELKRRFDTVATGLTAPLTEIDFLARLLPLVAAVKDGHTRMNLSDAAARDLQESRPLFFPFGLRFIEDRAYILRNLSSETGLKEGSELLSINGTPIAEVLAALLELIPSDAGIRTRKIRLLENPAVFGWYFAVKFGLSEAFRVGVRPYGASDIKEFTVPGIPGNAVNVLMKERYPDEDRAKPLYELSFRGATAVLTIRAFANAPGKNVMPYPEFLSNTFQTLKSLGVLGLVIDLRGNGGGMDEFGKLLFAYCTERPFEYYRGLESKKASYDFFRYSDMTQEDRDELAGYLKKNPRGRYDVQGHPNTGVQRPQSPPFRGRVAVLIDGLSFSATGETTSLFHYHRRAAFFGEECGSGYYGNASGFTTTVILPNTGIRLRVPLILYSMAVDGYPKDRGIIPDFPVQPTIEDLLAGRDPVMERALKYVTEKTL